MMTAAGAVVWDDANFASFDMNAFHRNSSIVLDTDFVAGLANYFSLLTKNPNDVRNLSDLARFTKDNPQEGYPDRDVRAKARDWNAVITETFTDLCLGSSTRPKHHE